MLKYLIVFVLAFGSFSSAIADDKVVLQLKWEHEFQFAGYYAALWQGYYQQAGLDVEIKPVSRPDGSLVIPTNEIEQERAQFAIGSLDILLAKNRGLDLKVLAPIFQRSPNAVFSLPQVPLDNLSQLAALRIAAVEGDTTKIEIQTMFKAKGFDLSKIQFVNEPITIDTLLANKADAIVSYEISAQTEAREKNVHLNKLYPADFGMDFYGDTLYTSAKLARQKPELVEKFLKASKKGWLYALNNKQEIATRIAKELPRHLFEYQNQLEYNLAFANLIDALVQYPQKPIGSINRERWFAMNEQVRALGLISSHLATESFFFEPDRRQHGVVSTVFFYSGLVLLLLLIFIFWYRRNLILTIALTLILALCLEYQLEDTLKKEQKQAEKLKLYRLLNSTSAKLEGDLQTNLSLLTGFAAYISAEPDLSNKDFKNYAREVFKKEPLLINFAAARDLVVNYVYPLRNNEKVIGLNYRENRAQRDMVMQVVNSGQLLVVGPVDLVQGGIAFIGRAPIFTGEGTDRRLWGIISSPLDADLLYRHSGITALAQQVDLAIKSYDLFGNAGAVFYGDETIFDNPERIESVVHVGSGTWRLAAIATSTNAVSSTNLILLRFFSLFTVILVSIFASYRFRQLKDKSKLEEQILNSQKLLKKVGKVARIGGWKLDKNLQFIQWSEQASSLLDKPLDFKPITLGSLSDLFEKQDFYLWRQKVEDLLANKITGFDIELNIKNKHANSTWLRIIASGSSEPIDTVTGTIQDVSDKVRSARLIEHQATYDALTDLPNRLLFNDRLSNTLENANRYQKKVAVLFIDLDQFKPVNDNYGHEIGDKVLVESAGRIQSCVRDSDTVSRLSGDEFGVILVNVNHYSDILKITELILAKMKRTYEVDSLSLHCGASIGISMYPSDAKDAATLLRKADQAMYEVKSSGRNGWQFYTQEMQERSERRHQLLNQLIEDLKADNLIPFFQPIYALNSEQITKCEVLARWTNQDGIQVPPIEFISLAEETGLINKIDIAMLRNSSDSLVRLNNQKNNIGLSINVSPRLFLAKDKALSLWLELVSDANKQLDITVEITERLLTDDSEKALSILNQLKALGIKIAIDDFGTGYSSLSYLVKFPVDILKIDRSFVDQIGKDKTAETLIETILVMAHKLGVEVIAEGIENAHQLEFLQRLKCHYGQGYFLAKPMDMKNFEALVNSNLEKTEP